MIYKLSKRIAFRRYYLNNCFPYLEKKDMMLNNLNLSLSLVDFEEERLYFVNLLFLIQLTHMSTRLNNFFSKRKHSPTPCLMDLRIRYEPLAMVTNSFPNNAARLNCAKLTNLTIKEPFTCLKTFHQYFPLLQMIFLLSLCH